jgi:CubicO group peptidase (beta-lactamase class C family)
MFKSFYQSSILIVIIFSTLYFTSGCSSSKSEKKSYTSAKPDSPKRLQNDLSKNENFATLDTTIARFVKYWGIKGVSVAITRYGNLVYARGFGYANLEVHDRAQPYHLFRVASVSKLITAVAIMRLVEAGKLKLSDKVFGPQGILNTAPYLGYVDKRVEEITVKQLLNHSAGWTTRWGDHLFMSEDIARALGKSLPVTKADIIGFALSKRLHFNPGTQSSYVNLGYLILEDVIEKVADRSYESFVMGSVFRPLDIDDAFIANNYDSLRYANEVRYYEAADAELSVSYDGSIKQIFKSRGGNDIRTLGAAGGWIISSVSLAKLIIAIEESSNSTLITKESIDSITNTKPEIHPLGWRMVMPDGSKWRTGSFSGTSATIVARPDGFTFVFLSNTSPWVGAKFPFEVNKMMARAIYKVKSWPDVNLFKYHTSASHNYVLWENHPRNNRFWSDNWDYPWLVDGV